MKPVSFNANFATCPKLIFFKLESGKNPVIEFFDSLNGKQVQKITWVLELFEEMSVVPKQYFKKLKNTDDIWEIRITFSGDIFRILGFFESNNNFVLTNGFIKKSQKTPQSEINLAEERKRNYFERKE